MQRNTSRLLVLSATAILLAACAPNALAPTDTLPPSPVVTQPQPTLPAERPTTGPDKPEMVDTPVSGESGGTVEVTPELMKILEADLKERLGSLPVDLKVIRGEAMVWNDGSLGCPQPGVFYTQSLVNGYWVVLQSGDRTYDYRIGNLATKPVLCESPLPTKP